MTKNLITYGGITLAIVLGVFGLFGRNTIIQQGSVVSLEQVDSPYYNIGGVKSYNFRQAFAATSTQVCTIVNPFKASSTLARFSATISTGILGTNKFTLSTTSIQASGLSYGSSTPVLILEHSVTASAVDAVLWYPSSASTTLAVLPGVLSTGESTFTLGPNDVLTYRYSTSTANTALSTYAVGFCSGTLQQL